jgi:hypothetical protein
VQDFKPTKRFPHVANLHRRHTIPPQNTTPDGKCPGRPSI